METPTLKLAYNGTSIPPGGIAPKQATVSPPTLSSDSTSPDFTYIVICIDRDAPMPALPILSPLLHWIQPGLRKNQAGSLETQDGAIVQWLKPSPPPLGGAHQYLFTLYEQPQDFDTEGARHRYPPDLSLWNRLIWNSDSFVRQFGLGRAITTGSFRV